MPSHISPTCSPSLAKLALRMLGATMMSLLLKESTEMREACTWTVLLRETARRAGRAVKAVDRADAIVSRCVRGGGRGLRNRGARQQVVLSC